MLTQNTIYRDYERIVSFMNDSHFNGIFGDYEISRPLIFSSPQDNNFLNLSNYLLGDSSLFKDNYNFFIGYLETLRRKQLRILIYSLFSGGDDIYCPGVEILNCDVMEICKVELDVILQCVVEKPNFFIICSHVFTPSLPMTLQVKLLHRVNDGNIYPMIGNEVTKRLHELISMLSGNSFFELLAINSIEADLQVELLSMIISIANNSNGLPLVWAVELDPFLRNFMLKQKIRLKLLKLKYIVSEDG